jgi:hypothetical protein
MGAAAKHIPAVLIAFCILMILVVPVLGWYGHGTFLALVILLATLSGIFDGIIARRLGISTTNLGKGLLVRRPRLGLRDGRFHPALELWDTRNFSIYSNGVALNH